MRSRKLRRSAIIFGFLSSVSFAIGQGNLPSPPGTADVELKGQKVTITYGRPSMRGRKIFGDLVPYGQVWRTGANEATTLTTPVNLSIGGTTIPSGKYTLWTLPGESSWKLIVNKQTGQWGTEYQESQDLARIDMKTSRLSRPVEQFMISWNKTGADRADLVLEWENTKAFVSVAAK